MPIPIECEANPAVIKKAIDQALEEADQQKISGAEITPFLLKRVNELSNNESSASNIELIKNNAALGANIAVQLSKLPPLISIDDSIQSNKDSKSQDKVQMDEIEVRIEDQSKP